MAHIHETKDAETHFIINATTREISNADELPALVQNDHNSERFTFVIPRFVDGHDMSSCNKTQVHYINIDAATKKQYADVYEIDDLSIDETDENKVVCTWLISRYATQYAGSLNFIIKYACEKDGVIDYAWNTAIFKGITVKNGINNAEQIMTEYTDILEKWRQEILQGFDRSRFSVKIVDALPEADISETTVYLLKTSRNVLSSAEGIGGDVYNNIGYKADTEYSFALAEELEAEGIYLSGLIPVKSGDVIKLNNITMNREVEKACRVFMFDERKHFRFLMNAEQLTDSNNAIWDECGNLVAFSAPESSDNNYIRIQAGYIGENSSIVINEQEGNLYAEYIYVNGAWEKLGSGDIASGGNSGNTSGKSAFEYAVEGGYSKSETEFYKDLASIGNGGNGGNTGNSGTSLQMVEIKLDYEEGHIHTNYNNTMTIECASLPLNARVRKIEIPDVVNETDELIALEDMISKDSEKIPYFVMYPKNMQGDTKNSQDIIMTVAARVFFPTTINVFHNSIVSWSFYDKTIKIYYEIEG